MAYREEDFEKLFDSFTSAGGGSSIKELYSIMPYLSGDQIKLINDAVYFAEKYQMEEIKVYIEKIIEACKHNRSLGLFASFKQFLKYMTLEEKFRGYKMQGTNITGDGQ